jgi:hypothetical protein
MRVLVRVRGQVPTAFIDECLPVGKVYEVLRLRRGACAVAYDGIEVWVPDEACEVISIDQEPHEWGQPRERQEG